MQNYNNNVIRYPRLCSRQFRTMAFLWSFWTGIYCRRSKMLWRSRLFANTNMFLVLCKWNWRLQLTISMVMS